jgi:3alpha(or 20beta)-hydroxysteroid dehydrogenase
VLERQPKGANVGRVEGKVAIVTGAARGMGAAHARRLVAEGAKVVLGDVLDAEGEATATALGDGARYVHLDVTKPADWDEAVAVALDEFGGLDILVNNAGVVTIAPIEEFTEAQWDMTMGINLKGQFLGIKAAVPALQKSTKGPSIVNISSVTGFKGYERMPAYVASKWGVRGLTKQAALDLGKYGIRVNSVHPGTIETPMIDGVRVDDGGEVKVALRRIGQPDEVTGAVVFLASDESSFCSGSEILVDGGEMAGEIA